MKTRNNQNIIFFILLAGVIIFTSSGVIIGKEKTETSKKKKIYITSLKSEHVKKQLLDRIRNGIFNSVLENYGTEYNLLDDEGIRVMFSQVAKIQASGCDDTSCISQIADGINADEIIYGEVNIDGSKITVSAKNLIRKDMELTTKSTISISFNESQADWYASEIARKLMDSKYKIDPSKAPEEFDSSVDIKGIAIGGVETFDIAVMNFTSSDDTISKILGYLKELVKSGDDYFAEKEYEDAIDKYKIVLNKIDNDLRSSNRDRIAPFRSEVVKRTDASYAMMYKIEMENVDSRLRDEDKADESFLNRIITKYTDVKNEMKKDIPPEFYGENTKKIEAAIIERIDSCHVAVCALHENSGDTAYSEYKFDKALGEYQKSLGACANISGNKKSELAARYNTKIATTYKTGASYLENRVISYADMIEFYNIQDKKSDAKSALKDIRNYITGGMGAFVTLYTIDIYNTAALLIKQDEITESSDPDLFKNVPRNDRVILQYRNKYKSIISSYNKTGNSYESWLDDNTYNLHAAGVPYSSIRDKQLRRKTALTAALLNGLFQIVEKFHGSKIDEKNGKQSLEINLGDSRLEGVATFTKEYSSTGINVKLIFPDKSFVEMDYFEFTERGTDNLDKFFDKLETFKKISIANMDMDFSFTDIYDDEDNCEVSIIVKYRGLKKRVQSADWQ